MHAGYKCEHAGVDAAEEDDDAAAGMGSGN
jgi:hypothetical protein